MEQKLRNAASKLPQTNLDFDAIQPMPKTSTRVPKWRVAVSLAACFVLLIAAGFGVYAEAREYNNAIRFFNNYGLSTEGLARGEIKAVYRDITTKSFTYSKTAEVIQKRLSAGAVGGYEIFQETPTPEELESFWNFWNDKWNFVLREQSGIHYRYRYDYKQDSQSDVEVLDKTYLEKYDGETLLWSAPISGFRVDGHSAVSDGVIAYGGTDTYSSGQRTYGWMVKFDADGNFCWQHMLNNGFEDEYIAEILENTDGTYAVISRGDLRYFCLSQYSKDGKELRFQKTEIGKYGIWNAARFGDGYLVQIGSYWPERIDKIVKVDRAGNITESFSYDAEDANYHITDMIEFNGNIYLSAYATPKLTEEESAYGGRSEIARILDYVFSREKIDISEEELTPLVRDNYTAVLLVCDPKSGIPKEFYSVAGSLGSTLAVTDGELVWDVESIATTSFSIATSSFTIGGTSHIFRYTFDAAGTLMRQEKTGEVTIFRR